MLFPAGSDFDICCTLNDLPEPGWPNTAMLSGLELSLPKCSATRLRTLL